MSSTLPLFHQKLKPRHRRLGTCHEPSVRGPARIDTKSQRGEPPTPCYVYLLLHKANERFKAGLSQAPKVRAAMLPDATCIALDRSIQVEFASPTRASEVERMLHKALAGFRMQVVGADGQAWDGGTEWFAMPGLRHAINLLRVTPLAGDGFEMAQLQTLEGEPYLDVSIPERMTTAQQRRQLAADHNLQRLSMIAGVLHTLNRLLTVEFREADPVLGTSARVCLHGFKDAWNPMLLKARFTLVSSALWVLHTGLADINRRTVPLVKLMQYSNDTPGMMELVVNDLSLIRNLPAGERVVRLWMGVMAELL